MHFFRCKVCPERAAQIKDLQDQVARLSTLLIPPTRANVIPLIAQEADAIIGGSQEMVVVSKEQAAEWERILAERSRILDGTY